MAFTLFASGSIIYGQNLFDELSEPQQEETVEITERIKNYKSNQLNKKVTKINLKKIKNIEKDGQFDLKLSDDKDKYTAHAQYVEVTDEENYQWNGEVLDKTGLVVGSVTLASVNSALFGEINVNERTIVIEDFGKSRQQGGKGRITYLIERDNEKISTHSCGTAVEVGHRIIPENRPEKNAEPRSMTCTNNVRVLVLFTPAANAAANGNQTAVDFINQANQALRNSAISAEQLTFQLAAVQQFNGINDQINVNNNGTATAEALRTALNSNGQVEDLRANNFDADLVVLLTNNPIMGNNNAGITGIANLHNLNDRTRAHSVVQILTGARFTFVHEMAHNFGCKHDADNATAEGLTVYAKGRAWTENGINRRTIMATAGVNERIQFFSNPNVRFNNIATGVANQQDNARQLKAQALKISRYEVGGDPVEAQISGPTIVYNTSSISTWCATSCNQGITGYQWAWSPNGFTYYNFGTNSSCASRAGNSFNTTATTVFIRVITTFNNGQTSTKIYPISNRQDIQQFQGNSTEVFKSTNTIDVDKMVSNVYPNPANDVMKLEIILPSDSDLNIEIYNELGQLEMNIATSKKFFKGITNQEIDLSPLSKGLKFIRIDNGIQIETLPVILK